MFYLIHYSRYIKKIVIVNKLIKRNTIEQITSDLNNFLFWALFTESKGNFHILSKKGILPKLICSFCCRIQHQNPQKSNNKLHNFRKYNPSYCLLSLLKLLNNGFTRIPIIRINYPLP
jgi:hypothetical protein